MKDTKLILSSGGGATSSPFITHIQSAAVSKRKTNGMGYAKALDQ